MINGPSWPTSSMFDTAAPSSAPSAADDSDQSVLTAAEDRSSAADFRVSNDRFAFEQLMRDDLAQTARDQIGDTQQQDGKASRPHRSHTAQHVHANAKHERAAWAKLAKSEHEAHAAHLHAKVVKREVGRHGHSPVHAPFAGNGVALHTTPQAAAAIAAGEHQRPIVDGVQLTYPSQDLTKIESTDPMQPGQTHGLTKHVGKSLEDNIDRLKSEPHIRAAGGYNDLASAQRATDLTIANPANQQFIGDFLRDPGRTKAALNRVDLGSDVGASTMRRDLEAGHPSLVPSHTATVVLIKDPTFPEGYRTLTSYPDAGRPPEVDQEGNHIA